MGLTEVLVPASIAVACAALDLPFENLLLVVAYALAGWRVLREAFESLLALRLDENVLMAVASVGALAVGEAYESVAVVMLYQVGEYLEQRAVEASRRSVTKLLQMRPESANLLKGERVVRVQPDQLTVGDRILVKPGERVPLDGKVLEGSSFMDTSALTGEPVPRPVLPGDRVLAGMVNGSGALVVEVTKRYSDSYGARVMKLVEEAAERKAPAEQFMARFARYYTPTVLATALAMAIIPPLVVPEQRLSVWLYRSLVFMGISCPCALVISIPLGYFAGIGSASRRGVIIKGGVYLSALARLHTLVFDKTGTLTRGVLKVARVVPLNGFTEQELLRLVVAAEGGSNHPLALCLREAQGDAGSAVASNLVELPGYGVISQVGGRRVVAGSDQLLHLEGIPHDLCKLEGTGMFVGVDGVLAGYITFTDQLKPGAREALQALREMGVKRMFMLTGDAPEAARDVAVEVGLDGFYASLLPEEKLHKFEEMKAQGVVTGFAGDGINDAPVLTRADVGIAMGALGSDAAVEAADVVVMSDSLWALVDAVKLAQRTESIVRQNAYLALVAKALFLALGAAGLSSLWMAVLADVGVALLTVLNATRAMG
ncbi:MAG: heavy metal translocating P-type ATPase [Bacillota bacterium]